MAEVLTTWSIPAESKEFIGPITVTADLVPVTNYEVAFTVTGEARPTTWTANDVVGGEHGILVGPGTPYALAAWSGAAPNGITSPVSGSAPLAVFGLNPGPYGMAQSGIPFTDLKRVAERLPQ